MLDKFFNGAANVGRVIQAVGSGGLSEIDRQQRQRSLADIGSILSGDQIPAFLRPGGAEGMTPEAFEAAKTKQLFALGTPEATKIGAQFIETPETRLNKTNIESQIKDREEMNDIRRQNLEIERKRMVTGADLPAAVREYQFYNKLAPEEKKTYLNVKRMSAEDVFDRKLSEKGAKAYEEAFNAGSQIASFQDSLGIARNALKEASMTGPIYGRAGKAASDPGYVNWQGAQNTLALQARTLLELPASGFSDADRDFLTDIVGGKYASAPAAQKSLDRLEVLNNKALNRVMARQKEILTRKAFNRENLPEEKIPTGGKVTPTVIKLDENFNIIE